MRLLTIPQKLLRPTAQSLKVVLYMENPDILILDEPMNGLDKQGVEEMRSLFSELRDQGKTILLVSHSGEDISSLCDTVCEMDRGNLTQLSV